MGLRKFNNWIKTLLINQYCQKGFNVFDICAGKGGDLTKWAHAKINRLFFADIAEISVKDAVDRYTKDISTRPKLHAFLPTFICADCHKPGLQQELERQAIPFDLVSCQFALHYSFESESSAKQFLTNVSCNLQPGGHFVATLPSASRIVDRVTRSPSLNFGNPFYKVTFEKKEFPRFGAKYSFTLLDAVDSVPEYLVHHETLVELAKACGLQFVEKQNFLEFYKKCKVPKNERLERTVRGESGPLDPRFQEIVGIYNIYVFKKVESVHLPAKNLLGLKKFPPVTEMDIIKIEEQPTTITPRPQRDTQTQNQHKEQQDQQEHKDQQDQQDQQEHKEQADYKDQDDPHQDQD
uniref:mRNA (guanine-N(7))-methyltransferase n=1 Tax=Arcella intermedia TaxID=1963864 RepID=A0A6B2L714_9EUKA